MLELERIAVDYGHVRALWDVSLEVKLGQRAALLGANGAGKSTTMGAICGLLPLAAGTVRFQGRELHRHSTVETVAAGIALVPEGRRLFPAMSVHENLLMGAYSPQARAHIDDSLRQVHELFPILKEKSRQGAGELSGGQQQQVAIGRALMSRPQVLLLDEPFIGVAPLVVREIIETLVEISARGVMMLLVEQNVHRALEFAEYAYVIENGRTVLEGSRDQILGDAQFNEKFLGLA